MKSADEFIERCLVRTGNFKDFVGVEELWASARSAAHTRQDSKLVWGMTRREFLDYLRTKLGLTHQVTRYQRLPKPPSPGVPQGVAVASYERLKWSDYAQASILDGFGPVRVKVKPRIRKRQQRERVS